MINRKSIKRNVKSSWKDFLEEFTIEYKIYNELNEFDHKDERTKIEGFYGRGKNLVVTLEKESATTNVNYNEILSCIIDDNTSKVQQHDFFNYNGITYEIIDIQNVENIYYDFTLKRIGG